MKDKTKIVEVLQALADSNGGVLLPEKVVEAAKSPNSPLHSEFTWDDGEAAKQHRLWQARQLIRVIVHVTPHTAMENRVWVSLTTDQKAGGGYRALVDVMSNEEHRQQLLADALHEAHLFTQKYQHLHELSEVFSAIQKVTEEHAPSEEAVHG